MTTIKIDKQATEYLQNTIGQGGGGSGSVNGFYAIPGIAVTSTAFNYSGTIDLDLDVLAEYLENSGVDLDEIVLREEEENYKLNIGSTNIPQYNTVGREGDFYSLISIIADLITNHQGQKIWSVELYVNVNSSIPTTSLRFVLISPSSPNNTLRAILEELKNSNLNYQTGLQDCADMIYSNKYYNNDILISRRAIEDYQLLEMKDMSEFIKKVIIPYGSGSGSN